MSKQLIGFWPKSSSERVQCAYVHGFSPHLFIILAGALCQRKFNIEREKKIVISTTTKKVKSTCNAPKERNKMYEKPPTNKHRKINSTWKYYHTHYLTHVYLRNYTFISSISWRRKRTENAHASEHIIDTIILTYLLTYLPPVIHGSHKQWQTIERSFFIVKFFPLSLSRSFNYVYYVTRTTYESIEREKHVRTHEHFLFIFIWFVQTICPPPHTLSACVP